MIYPRMIGQNTKGLDLMPGNGRVNPLLRLLLIGSCIILIMTVWMGTVQASGGINMKAQAGLAGYARNGHYIPVQVFIENQGAPISGQLELKTADGDGLVVYQHSISLARGANKRVNMYLPRGNSNPYSVDFMSGKKKLASAKLRLTLLPSTEIAAGILAADPAALKNLENVKFAVQTQHLTAVNLKAEDIPEQGLCLDSLDILAVDDFSSRSLSARQLKAIGEWTQNGGLLVLVGGPAWQKTLSAISPGLLPVKVEGSTQVAGLPGIETLAGDRLTSAQPLVVSQGKLQSGKVLLAAGDIPVIVQKKVGSGDVVYLAFDLAQPPFDKWAATPALWKQLLYKTDPHHIMTAGASPQDEFRNYNFDYNLRSFPAVGLPTAKTLAVVMLIYVLVLGPGIYLLLKKFDRRDLGWVAIPLLALVLFSLTYATAFKGKGRDVFTNVISLLSLQEEGQGAYLDTHVGIFAPTKTRCQVSMPGDQVLNVSSNGQNGSMRVTSSYPGVAPTNEENQVVARVEQGDDVQVSFGESTRWSLRSLQSERILDKCGRIGGKIVCSGGAITGTITNNTDYYLTGTVVFNSYCRQRIGNLKPGQSATLDMTPRVATQGRGMMGRAVESYPVNWPRNMNSRNDRINNLTSQMLAMASSRRELAQSPLMLMAYSSEAPRQKIISGQGGTTYYSTVILAPLALQTVERGRAELLPGLVKGYITSFAGRNIYADPWGFNIDAGMATFQMNLPFSSQDLQVEELRVFVESNDFRQAMLTKIRVLNNRSGEWENLAYNAQGILLENGERYISREGAVLVQIGTDTNMQVGGVSMSLKGKYNKAAGQTAAAQPSLGGGGI